MDSHCEDWSRTISSPRGHGVCFQEEKEIGTAMQSFSLPVIAVMVAKFSLCFFLREFTDKVAKVNSKVWNQIWWRVSLVHFFCIFICKIKILILLCYNLIFFYLIFSVVYYEGRLFCFSISCSFPFYHVLVGFVAQDRM